jgi:hypothetical protein
MLTWNTQASLKAVSVSPFTKSCTEQYFVQVLRPSYGGTLKTRTIIQFDTCNILWVSLQDESTGTIVFQEPFNIFNNQGTLLLNGSGGGLHTWRVLGFLYGGFAMFLTLFTCVIQWASGSLTTSCGWSVTWDPLLITCADRTPMAQVFLHAPWRDLTGICWWTGPGVWTRDALEMGRGGGRIETLKGVKKLSPYSSWHRESRPFPLETPLPHIVSIRDWLLLVLVLLKSQCYTHANNRRQPCITVGQHGQVTWSISFLA